MRLDETDPTRKFLAFSRCQEQLRPAEVEPAMAVVEPPTTMVDALEELPTGWEPQKMDEDTS
jgi:hypothetical protein